MRAVVTTASGFYAVDLETEEVEPSDAPLTEPEVVVPELPRVIAAAAAGSTVIALVAARPPLLVSYDAGTTWNESGRGLPPGVAIAISPESPDVAVYASRDRLFMTRDGGRFWHSLEPEFDEIEAVHLE